MEKADYKLLMKAAVLAGEIMLKSGAEAYRAEDTIMHMLKTSGAETVESYVVMTGIVATIDNPDMEALTVVKRVGGGSTNLNNIAQVNEVSRQLCAGNITVEEAYTTLKQIKGSQYSRLLYTLATIGICIGFVPFFGGGLLEVLAAVVVGLMAGLTTTACKVVRLKNGFLENLLYSFVAAFVAIYIKGLFPEMDMDIVIISSIMPVVPGVAITNAIRDIMEGDYLSGMARVLSAFMTAVSIAVGVACAMGLSQILLIGGGLF